MEKDAKRHRMVWQHRGKNQAFLSENLRDQLLSWASNLADISDEENSIIKHARKSLLFNITENRGSKTTIAICLMLPWVAMTGQKFANYSRSFHLKPSRKKVWQEKHQLV